MCFDTLLVKDGLAKILGGGPLWTWPVATIPLVTSCYRNQSYRHPDSKLGFDLTWLTWLIALTCGEEGLRGNGPEILLCHATWSHAAIAASLHSIKPKAVDLSLSAVLHFGLTRSATSKKKQTSPQKKPNFTSIIFNSNIVKWNRNNYWLTFVFKT